MAAEEKKTGVTPMQPEAETVKIKTKLQTQLKNKDKPVSKSQQKVGRLRRGRNSLGR